MRTTAGIFSIGLMAATWLPTSIAQQPEDSLDAPITLETAMTLALNNPVLDAAGEANLKAAEARLDAAGLLPSPEFRMTYDDRWTGETGREYAIRLSPPNPWLRKALQDEGELGINFARVQLAGIGWASAIETRKAFYEALHTSKLTALAQLEQQTASKKKSLYETLLSNGQTTLPEVLEVRLEGITVAANLEAAQRNASNAMNRLLARTGLKPQSGQALAGDFEVPPPGLNTLDAEGLFLNYAAQHPLLAGLQLQADMAGARAQQTTARNRIWFNFLQAGYSENSNWWEEEDWRFRAGINIPIFDLQGKASRVPKAEQEALAAQVKLLRQQTIVNLTEALANLKVAAHSLQQAGEISDAVAEEVRKTLAEDAAAAEPMLPPQTRFRLQEGLQRIQISKLTNAYRYQQAVLALEEVLGKPFQSLLERSGQ